MASAVRTLTDDFREALSVADWDPPSDVVAAAQAAIEGCCGWRMLSGEKRHRELIALVNAKLRLNKERFREFLDRAAARKAVLNYHDKAEVQDCFDRYDRDRLASWLVARGYDASLLEAFRPVTRSETLKGLHEQLRTGAVARSDARDCDVSERKSEVLRALFGSYVFRAYPREAMHTFFNADSRKNYLPDFYDHLLEFHSGALRRDCALVFLNIDKALHATRSGNDLRDALFSFVERTYERLSNHCFFAVLIQPFDHDGESGQWQLFSDLVLFAEKHKEVRLTAGYFCPDQIEANTVQHVRHLDTAAAQFSVANEGFFFRDCFVVLPNEHQPIETTDSPVNLLVLFEKNERDETPLPCPACRTKTVAGNSYPVLGVRSWECQNPICPERSAFDRGNRYSLSALIKQQAIRSEPDQVPEWSLRKWKLDVVADGDERSVARMLIMHFTLHDDTVVFVNISDVGHVTLGRKVLYEGFPAPFVHGSRDRFNESAFFRRFVIDREVTSQANSSEMFPSGLCDVDVYQGDCFEVLARLGENTIDGAVTSPPYYNARSYTTWPNIYCYLYDMYNSARHVFRVLRPGAVYIFNVFDYFDNENNIVVSAMGKKRMILGAYIVNIFRRVGFKLRGNVVWYKGEIEGKRNFNQGNRSPYYQFPFNCWEHVLVFYKPGGNAPNYRFPTILSAKPVIKMVRGENIHGHSAPLREDIPGLLV